MVITNILGGVYFGYEKRNKGQRKRNQLFFRDA